MKTVLRMVLVHLVAAAGLLAVVPADAQADPYTAADYQYLGMLSGNGVHIDPPTAIALGHSVVDYLTAHPNDDGVNYVLNAGVLAGISPQDIAAVVYAAVFVYAPGLLPVLKHWVDNSSGGVVLAVSPAGLATAIGELSPGPVLCSAGNGLTTWHDALSANSAMCR